MNLSKIQSNLNKTSRLIGDVNAVKKGRAYKRMRTRAFGRNPLLKIIKMFI